MKNKSKIGIVIDSTTILNSEIIKEYEIEIVSLNVTTSDFTKKEIETTNEEIISRLDDVKNLKTAAPSPSDFVEAYKRLFAKGYQKILCFPLSRELSSTFDSAMIGKTYLRNPDDVYVCDSLICNYGLANLIESMLPLFERDNITFEEMKKAYHERSKNSDVEFSVINLRHLVAGGRLSKIAGLLGTILHIKPIIRMIGGKLKLYKKELNMTKVFAVFMACLQEYSQKCKNLWIKVIDLMQNDLAEKLANQIKALFPHAHVSRISTVGPTFYIHLGNNGVGICVTAFN